MELQHGIKTALIALGFSLCASTSSLAAKNAADSVDIQMTKYLDAIQNLVEHNDGNSYLALTKTNKELKSFVERTCTDPNLIKNPLKQAKDHGMSILTSDDHKVRYFSWDTRTGGTMHFYNSIVSWNSGNKQWAYLDLTKGKGEDPEPGEYYNDLWTFTTKEKQTVYLVKSLSVGSSRAHGIALSAFTIKNGKLTPYPFFQTTKKLLTEISYGFGLGDDKCNPEMSSDKMILKIPIVIDDHEGGASAGKYLIYRYNGRKFLFENNKTATFKS